MNKEFLKMQKMAGIITEGQFKQLTENEDYFQPTHTSNVDWYLVYNSPNKSGAMVAHDPDYNAPKGEILIYAGDEVMKVGEEMENEEGTRVEYVPEYFDLISEGQVNENEDNDDRFTIIDDLVDRELYNNFINAVEAIQNVTIGQSGITPEDVYEYLTLSMERDA